MVKKVLWAVVFTVIASVLQGIFTVAVFIVADSLSHYK